MKKFVVLFAVVAMTCFSTMAFAADVTVGGSLEIRSRNFNELDLNEDAVGGDVRDTQTRVKVDVNAKAGDVKGKISLWNDFETWNGLEAQDGTGTIGIREAWVNFNLPGIPVNVNAGHQLLSLGNGWFFRSTKNGSDAWVVANQSGNNTLAFVNVKVAENVAANHDDVDAYVLLDVFKLSDTATVGVDLTNVKNRTNKAAITDLQNIGVNFNGNAGPVKLKAEIDMQMGKVDNAAGSDPKFKGTQVVVQGSVPVASAAVNFTVATGSGDDSGADNKQIVTFLDANPHYTFIYEYLIATAAGAKNTGFANTTAFSVGVSAPVSKSVTVAADAWMLQATETAAGVDDSIGTEVDVKVNWKVADNLAWNWTVGYFMPGDFYGSNADDAMAIAGVLAFTF